MGTVAFSISMGNVRHKLSKLVKYLQFNDILLVRKSVISTERLNSDKLKMECHRRKSKVLNNLDENKKITSVKEVVEEEMSEEQIEKCLEKGVELAQKANTEDNRKNYEKSIQYYRRAIYYLEKVIKYPGIKDDPNLPLMQSRADEYRDRMNLLMKHLQAKSRLENTKSEGKSEEKSSKKYECRICWEESKSYYMFNCGHLPFCEDCSERICEELKSQCPICRKEVSRQKIFF